MPPRTREKKSRKYVTSQSTNVCPSWGARLPGKLWMNCREIFGGLHSPSAFWFIKTRMRGNWQYPAWRPSVLVRQAPTFCVSMRNLNHENGGRSAATLNDIVILDDPENSQFETRIWDFPSMQTELQPIWPVKLPQSVLGKTVFFIKQFSLLSLSRAPI